MPPRKQKIIQEQVLEEKREPSAKKEKRHNLEYKCPCGKMYGSERATHQHMKQKHPSQLEKMKKQMIKPQKIAERSSQYLDNGQKKTQIRLSSRVRSLFNQQLMVLFSATVQKIQETPGIKTSFFYSDQIVPEDTRDYVQYCDQFTGKLVEDINKIVEQSINDLNLQQINRYVEGAQQLKTFKIQIQSRNLIYDLIKTIKDTNFAAKINLSIKLIHSMAKTAERQPEFAADLAKNLKQIWREFNCPDLEDILTDYYEEWNKICSKYPEQR